MYDRRVDVEKSNKKLLNKSAFKGEKVDDTTRERDKQDG